jgi:hypothetical protein
MLSATRLRRPSEHDRTDSRSVQLALAADVFADSDRVALNGEDPSSDPSFYRCLHAEIGFQAVRVTVRHDGSVPPTALLLEGAVRTELRLLIAVAAGMGQAMDTWLLTQTSDAADLHPLI